MLNLKTEVKKLNFFHLARLNCPYCGKHSLLKGPVLTKPLNWFFFAKGCPECRYLYEREEGYFAGSTWMVNYFVISVFGLAVAAYCGISTDLDGLMTATVTSLSIIVFGLFFFPYGTAIWMYFDHSVHPLKDEERQDILP